MQGSDDSDERNNSNQCYILSRIYRGARTTGTVVILIAGSSHVIVFEGTDQFSGLSAVLLFDCSI